jgi:hypothetical protein
MSSSTTTSLQLTTLCTSLILLITSLITLGLSGHTTWLLDKYFPGGAWYIWKGLDATTYGQQQTPQQWVTADYEPTTESLAYMRAVVGGVAGVLGIWTVWCEVHRFRQMAEKVG